MDDLSSLSGLSSGLSNSNLQNLDVSLTLPNRVSAKRKFRNIYRPHAATQLVFLVQFYMVIVDHISQNQCSNVCQRVGEIYMVEYCEFFKMAFAKILDFWHRLNLSRSKFAMKLLNDISND